MTSDAGQPGTPRFNVVLRGYDRRQVDEHVARLQRVIARMRADLSARSQFPEGPGYGNPQRPPHPQGWSGSGQGPGQGAGRGTPPGESPDAIAGFTDRMQRILQSAEEEAEEIRNKARMAARAESEQVRAQLDELARQRDGMLRELAQIRGHLHEQAPDHTTRMPRPISGGPPPNEPARGGMPSPHPRPGGPPPASPPSVSQPPVSQPPAAQSPGGPPAGRPAAPPPDAPRSSMGRRPGWSGTPPLWESKAAWPPGASGEGAVRPDSRSEPSTPTREPRESAADPIELQPVIPMVGADAAPAGSSRRDPESTDQLSRDPAGEQGGGAGPPSAQNGSAPAASAPPARSDGDVESGGQPGGSQPPDAETARSGVDTGGSGTAEPESAGSDADPDTAGAAAADRAGTDPAGTDPAGADPQAADLSTAGSAAASSAGASPTGAGAGADPATSDSAEGDTADPDVEKTMVVQAVRSSPPTRPGPGSDQGRGTEPGTDQSRPAGYTSRSG